MSDKTIDISKAFELNGETYAPIIHPQRKKSNYANRGLLPIMAMGLMMMPEIGKNFYERKLPPGTDIVKEYERIQKKESKLSRWERDTVVRIFEQNFVKIKK